MLKLPLFTVCLAFVLTGADNVRAPLTNDDVIALLKAGFREALVVNAINSSDARFDVSSTAVAYLRRAGVGESVIAAMAKAEYGPAQHLRLLDPGVYVRGTDAYALVDAEPIEWRSAASTLHTPEGTFTRVSLIGRVENRTARLTLSGFPELLIVSADDASDAGYQLLRGEIKQEGREFRAEAAVRNGKLIGLGSAEQAVLQADVDAEFDLGIRWFLRSLPKGEYALVPPGILTGGHVIARGKIYTFTIE